MFFHEGWSHQYHHQYLKQKCIVTLLLHNNHCLLHDMCSISSTYRTSWETNMSQQTKPLPAENLTSIKMTDSFLPAGVASYETSVSQSSSENLLDVTATAPGCTVTVIGKMFYIGWTLPVWLVKGRPRVESGQRQGGEKRKELSRPP